MKRLLFLTLFSFVHLSAQSPIVSSATARTFRYMFENLSDPHADGNLLAQRLAALTHSLHLNTKEQELFHRSAQRYLDRKRTAPNLFPPQYHQQCEDFAKATASELAKEVSPQRFESILKTFDVPKPKAIAISMK